MAIDLRALTTGGDDFMGLPDAKVRLRSCRSFEQFCSTLRALVDPPAFCPFCPRQYDPTLDLAPDLKGRWWLRKNAFPRPGTQHMSLIVPWDHVVSSQELTEEDWIWIGRLFRYAQDKLGLPGGGLALRFGDTHYHSGTIPHLHFNVIVPVPESGQDCFVPLSDNHEIRFESRLSLLLHGEELKRRGGLGWLFSKEGVASTGG